MGRLVSHTNHTINSQIHPDCQGFEDSAVGDSRWGLFTIALTAANFNQEHHLFFSSC
jgi:hypothetical protein